MILPRQAKEAVRDGLRRQAAVGLIGPRQVGKTTLALEIGRDLDGLYIDLEDPDGRAMLGDPAGFLSRHEDRLVILDEFHRVPDLFQPLRGIIDAGRRKGKGRGRFLILGSASVELLRQSGESLAGRITYIELGPVTLLEAGPDTADRLWLRGGFPDSLLATDDAESMAWRLDFIRTYLERDVPLFGPRVPAQTLERLWTMLAHRQGQLLNASDLARALDVSVQTTVRYIDLLVDLLLLRRLRPFHANIGKRLVKSPKVYIRDSGLLHGLLRIEDLDRLAAHPIVGHSWEGFVIETLLSHLPARAQPFFFRSAGGAEIDLLLEWPDGTLWAIAIKRRPSARPERGFHAATRDLAPARSFLVHAGSDAFPLAEGTEAVGLADMARTLARQP